jgi:hypothetical protein
MGTFRPEAQLGRRYRPPAELQGDLDRTTGLALAAILLYLVGFFNIIDGISALSGSKYLTSDLLFANLKAWGAFFLAVGIIQILAGWGVMKGAGWAAIVGLITAFVNAISQFSDAHTFSVWALTILAIDVFVIYGLARYGGARGRTT